MKNKYTFNDIKKGMLVVCICNSTYSQIWFTVGGKYVIHSVNSDSGITRGIRVTDNYGFSLFSLDEFNIDFTLISKITTVEIL